MDSLKSPPPLFISLLKLFFGVVLGIFILIAGIFGYKFLYVIIIYTKWLIPPITGALHLPADFRGVAVTEVIVLATVFLAVWLLLRVFLAFTWISFWRDILLLKGKEKLFRVMTRITKIIFYSPYMCNGILWIIVIIGMINTARTVEHQKAYSEDAKSKATISNYTETPLVIPGTGKTVGLKVQFDLVYPPPPAEIRKNDYIMLPSFNIKSNQPIAPSRSGWLC